MMSQAMFPLRVPRVPDRTEVQRVHSDFTDLTSLPFHIAQRFPRAKPSAQRLHSDFTDPQGPLLTSVPFHIAQRYPRAKPSAQRWT